MPELADKMNYLFEITQVAKQLKGFSKINCSNTDVLSSDLYSFNLDDDIIELCLVERFFIPAGTTIKMYYGDTINYTDFIYGTLDCVPFIDEYISHIYVREYVRENVASNLRRTFIVSFYNEEDKPLITLEILPHPNITISNPELVINYYRKDRKDNEDNKIKIFDSRQKSNVKNIDMSRPIKENPDLPITELDLSNKKLRELSDLSRYSNLQKLNCNWNSIANLDNLPSTLTHLSCSGNNLSSLDNLPSGLVYLECVENNLIGLDNLPCGLIELHCDWNKILSLDYLPPSLISLSCAYNRLINLEYLPRCLKELYCDHNNLIELKDLPKTLVYVDCRDNEIKNFDNLPSGLKIIR